MTCTLYDYWRSSAAYRVRIALALKGVDYTRVTVDLAKGGQKEELYRAHNPQGLVPMLEMDGKRLTQSLAIIEWLDNRFPEPRLIPSDPDARSDEMAKAMIVAADIHPINNLRVLKYLKHPLGHDQPEIDDWIRHWISEGFAALEKLAAPEKPFLSGDAPGLADCFLMPQTYNARRFETDLTPFPKLLAIEAACVVLPAFQAAHPDSVKAAE